MFIYLPFINLNWLTIHSVTPTLPFIGGLGQCGGGIGMASAVGKECGL